ncbi:hypothetical protein L596_027143 [Steinernema carpocapsae]|uniref:Uncharacterized protein n=1 Tax=Steinernema carpocapsae TaxID=34508 RepID=A0A4U5M3I8_STECR|nr:hypothetical protein L596_027143 [Steinernema carpocapsae]
MSLVKSNMAAVKKAGGKKKQTKQNADLNDLDKILKEIEATEATKKGKKMRQLQTRSRPPRWKRRLRRKPSLRTSRS